MRATCASYRLVGSCGPVWGCLLAGMSPPGSVMATDERKVEDLTSTNDRGEAPDRGRLARVAGAAPVGAFEAQGRPGASARAAGHRPRARGGLGRAPGRRDRA